MLDITKKGTDAMIFKPEKMIGIISKVARILQDQTGNTTTKLKQILQIQKGREAL